MTLFSNFTDLDCGNLAVKNAVLNTSDTTYGTVVQATCVTGYVSNESDVVTCTESGVWSKILSSCVPIGNASNRKFLIFIIIFTFCKILLILNFHF